MVGSKCEIQQVGKLNKVVHVTLEKDEDNENVIKPIKTFGPENLLENRIHKGSGIGTYTCGIDIMELSREDAGELSCTFIFTNGKNETGTFILDNIELTTTTTTTKTATTTTLTITITTTATTNSTTSLTTIELESESPSIGAIIGLIITIICGIVITIVVLAYFDIIKCFRFLPRRSPGLRQVDEMKRENMLRKRFRQSMHTFMDYVEKQTGSRSK